MSSACSHGLRHLTVASLLSILLASCGGNPSGPPDDDGSLTPQPNKAPVVTISAPATSATFEHGTAISFNGSAQDPEEGALTGDDLVWLIGALPGAVISTGTSFNVDTLPVGDHVVRLVATDSAGAADTAQVEITVESNAPTFSETHYARGMRTLIAHNGRFYHAFSENSSGDWDVYLRTSDDGINWSEAVPVSGPVAGDQLDAQITAWGAGAGTIAISWKDGGLPNPQLFAAVSTDGGLHFGTAVQVSNHTDSRDIHGGIAAGEDGVLYAAWTRQHGSDRWDATWFSRSMDAGASWSDPIVAFAGNHYSHDTQIVAGAAGNVWIAIADDQSYKINLMMRRSTDGGASWTTSNITNYTTTGKLAIHQSLAIAPDGMLYVIWQDIQERYTGPARVVISRSDDNGATWSTPVQLSDDVAISPADGHDRPTAPSLSIGPAGTLYAAWADDRSAPGSNYDIYLDRSSDGGLTWGGDVLANDMPEVDEQIMASVAAGDDGVLVAWRDRRHDPFVGLWYRLDP